jgi:hypothetical protein
VEAACIMNMLCGGGDDFEFCIRASQHALIPEASPPVAFFAVASISISSNNFYNIIFTIHISFYWVIQFKIKTFSTNI